MDIQSVTITTLAFIDAFKQEKNKKWFTDYVLFSKKIKYWDEDHEKWLQRGFLPKEETQTILYTLFNKKDLSKKDISLLTDFILYCDKKYAHDIIIRSSLRPCGDPECDCCIMGDNDDHEKNNIDICIPVSLIIPFLNDTTEQSLHFYLSDFIKNDTSIVSKIFLSSGISLLSKRNLHNTLKVKKENYIIITFSRNDISQLINKRIENI